MTKAISMTGKSQFKRGLNALEAKFQESAEPEAAAIEFAAQAKAGAFDGLQTMTDAELQQLRKLAYDAYAPLTWHSKYKDECELCGSVHGKISRELRDRQLEREERDRAIRERRYGVIESSKAISKLAEFAAMSDEYRMLPPAKVAKVSNAAMEMMDERQLRNIINDNTTAIGHPSYELDSINQCVECLELAKGWQVADLLLSEVCVVRDALAANVKMLAVNEQAAYAELKRRADEKEKEESMKHNMPEIVKQLEERVHQLESGANVG